MLSSIWLCIWVISLSVEFDLVLCLSYEFKC